MKCDFPGCVFEAATNGYCIRHSWMQGSKKPKAVGIRPISEKRELQDKEYVPKKRKFLKAHPLCQIQCPECTGKATTINHTRGREGANYLDETTWQASCHRCNNYIEENDSWAREHGHKKSKHQIN